MNEIIKSITEAEEKAAGIKAEALKKAAEIAAAAEIRADEIEKKCETDCKLYRENALKKANYDKALTDKRAEAKEYADAVLKKTDGVVNDIVRRITRGSC